MVQGCRLLVSEKLKLRFHYYSENFGFFKLKMLAIY